MRWKFVDQEVVKYILATRCNPCGKNNPFGVFGDSTNKNGIKKILTYTVENVPVSPFMPPGFSVISTRYIICIEPGRREENSGGGIRDTSNTQSFAVTSI
ncbi:hypothetical protein EGI32_11600 [Ferruginibacter sp. HRS2-29]|nr:hypothetical protein [Ferruginibacter sp. HRS2-29]